MSGDIDVREVQSISVSTDGTAFRLGVVSAERSTNGLVFPSSLLKSLVINLCRAADVAFKRQLNDDAVRLVYPVDRCSLQHVEGSDQTALVLRSPDGFEIAFALSPDQIESLAEFGRVVRPCPEVPQSLN